MPTADRIDVDSLLGDLDDHDTATDDSPWGGANLVAPRSCDRPRRPHGPLLIQSTIVQPRGQVPSLVEFYQGSTYD